jgi:MFS family permease
MSTSGTTLRPRSLGEILDRTAQLYRGNFLLFAGISIMPMAAVFLVFVPVGVLIGIFGATRGTFPSTVWSVSLVLIVLLAAIPVLILATVYTQAGLSLAAVRTHMGQKLKIRAVLKDVQPNFWRYVWLLILQGIVVAFIPCAAAGIAIGVLVYLGTLAGNGTAAGVGLGFIGIVVFIATVVVVVWRAMCYSLGMAICVAEGLPAWESLKRSLELTKGSRGRIFVMFLLVWALSIVISMIGYIPSVLVIAIVTAIGHGAQYGTIAVAAAQIINFLVNFSMQTLITPVYIMALVLFYYDQRVRTEGYDIQWMMEQAGWPGSGATAGALGGPDVPLAGVPAVSSEPAAGPDSLKEP